MTDSEPETGPVSPGGVEESPGAEESPEEKRARVMARLAEILRGDPPDLSGSGAVSAGELPALPSDADEFDQESAGELLAALGEFFERRTRPQDRDPEEPQTE